MITDYDEGQFTIASWLCHVGGREMMEKVDLAGLMNKKLTRVRREGRAEEVLVHEQGRVRRSEWG